MSLGTLVIKVIKLFTMISFLICLNFDPLNHGSMSYLLRLSFIICKNKLLMF